MPGFNSEFGSATVSVTLNVAVLESTVGATSCTCAGNCRPGKASTVATGDLADLQPRSSRSGTKTAARNGVGLVTRNATTPDCRF